MVVEPDRAERAVAGLWKESRTAMSEPMIALVVFLGYAVAVVLFSAAIRVIGGGVDPDGDFLPEVLAWLWPVLLLTLVMIIPVSFGITIGKYLLDRRARLP